MGAFTPVSRRDAVPLRWVVAAPGEGPVDWVQIVSEDEDGALSGWARDGAANETVSAPARLCA